MIRILIVDDHAIVRAGVRYLVDAINEITVVAEAGGGTEALKAIVENEIDVVLLDIGMPDQSGVEVLRQIKSFRPALPVLILSMHPANKYAVQLMRAGAAGYVQKEALATELVSAIKTVVQGKKYISYAVAELLTADPSSETDAPLHTLLSARESEIFMRLSRGQTPTTITADLDLSVKTVSTYRTRVLEKMRLTSNADIIYYALKNKLIE
ncbi:MAG: response regulator transcription factor [Pseudomonadota bacterium]|nr:response regulator transcription factor [Pseudomonadota bacterium]